MKEANIPKGGHSQVQWVIHQTIHGEHMGAVQGFYIGEGKAAVLCGIVIVHSEGSSLGNIICEAPDTIFHVKQKLVLYYPTLVTRPLYLNVCFFYNGLALDNFPPAIVSDQLDVHRKRDAPNDCFPDAWNRAKFTRWGCKCLACEQF